MKTFTFLFVLIKISACIVVVKNVTYDFNKEFGGVRINIITPPNEQSLINAEFNFTGECIEKIMAYAKLFVHSDTEDKRYRKEFMRVAIDMETLFNGGVTSFIGKTFAPGLTGATDFPLKFPFKKGSYHLTNYTVTDQFVRFLLSKDFFVDFRFTGTVKKGSKKMVFLMHVAGYASIV